MRYSPYIIAGLTVVLLIGCSRSADTPPRVAASPKLVLIIGDGMDDQQITMARNYLVGISGRLALDAMSYRGSLQAQGISRDDPTKPAYTTNSNVAATAMATGVVTSMGRVATTALTDEDIVSIMELAKDAGMGTGIVTTASVTDATPASFMAHVSARWCEGPENMVSDGDGSSPFSYDCTSDYKSNGGKGSIAEQIAEAPMDVVFGGGAKYFDQVAEGESDTRVLQLAIANGYTVVTATSDLQNLPFNSRILGLFAPERMPAMLQGNGASKVSVTGGNDRQVTLPEPYTCEENPEFVDMPKLVEMTRAAVKHLERRGSFMLVVENESIDEESHVRRPCGQIGGVGQIDETVRYVLDYAKSHPELLIIVVADHGHAAQIVPGAGWFVSSGNIPPGLIARLITTDGSIMGINYATAAPGFRESHTGVQVPIYATGPDVESWPVFMPQTKIFQISKNHLGLK